MSTVTCISAFNRASLVAAVTGVASLLLGFTPATAAPAACVGPIKFGLTSALTGNVALLGIQARNGVEFAVDEINKAGGIAGQQVALSSPGSRGVASAGSDRNGGPTLPWSRQNTCSWIPPSRRAARAFRSDDFVRAIKNRAKS